MDDRTGKHRHYFHSASRIIRLPGRMRSAANKARKGQFRPMFCACGTMRVSDGAAHRLVAAMYGETRKAVA